MKPLFAAAAAALAGVALQAAPSIAADRCTTAEPPSARADLLGTSDCSLAQTVPGPQWEPAEIIRIPVVVHVIMDAACTNGNLSNSTGLTARTRLWSTRSDSAAPKRDIERGCRDK